MGHEENKADAPHSPATTGNRSNLANGRIESPGGAGWQIAGALQTRQARCRPDPDFRQRQAGRGEIPEKEQGGFDSRITCQAGFGDF